MLGIVYRAIAAHLIQRFGSALNLNIHFHQQAQLNPDANRPEAASYG